MGCRGLGWPAALGSYDAVDYSGLSLSKEPLSEELDPEIRQGCAADVFEVHGVPRGLGSVWVPEVLRFDCSGIAFWNVSAGSSGMGGSSPI